MDRPILNLDELEFQPWGRGELFEARLGAIGSRIGARKLGYNLTALPPGKRAFPFHSHRVNEEMFFVVEGEGEIRIGPERFPIRTGDVIACPPGGPEAAHQIINTSDSEFKYLAVATAISPELAEYPDSGKYGVIGTFPNERGGTDGFRFMMKKQADFDDYWEGET